VNTEVKRRLDNCSNEKVSMMINSLLVVSRLLRLY